MLQAIGKIGKIDGKFFIKAIDGSLREASIGDEVYNGEVVIGDSSNSESNSLIVGMNEDYGDIIILGNQTQKLDISFTSEGFAQNETESDAGLVEATVDDIDSQDDIDDMETAAGQEEVLSSTTDTRMTDFSDKSEDLQDINAELRGVERVSAQEGNEQRVGETTLFNNAPIALDDTIVQFQNNLIDVTPAHASINAGNSDVGFTDAFTISQTITSTGNGGIIFNNENAYEIAQEANGSIRYALRADNGSGWVWNDTGYDLPFNEEHTLTFSYDGANNTVKLYVDGTEVSSNTQNVPDSLRVYANNDLLFGERGNNNQSFEGTFDDIQIYNEALSATEIQTIANGGVISGASLVSHYDFEGSNPLTDKSGNGHDATLVNGATLVDSFVQGTIEDIQVDEDNSLTIDARSLLINDTDTDGDTLAISEVNATADTHGTVSLDANGNVVFTPETNYNGEASFTYIVSDGQGGSDSATVTVNVVSDGDDTEVIIAQTSTDGSDSIITGNGDDIIDAGAGNDYIDAGAGTDSINAGSGNDTIVFDNADTVDGADGLDTLLVNGDISIDFSGLADNISNIETIDLGTDAQNIITLTVDDVFNMTDNDNLLRIDGDSSDSIDLNTVGGDAEWILGDFQTTDETTGQTYDVYTNIDESVTLEISTDIMVDES